MTTYKSNLNVYQQITDRVIAAIEAGAPKFEMPWHRGSSHSRPVNVLTGKNYRGVNTVALWVAQMEYGYTTGTWGTYKQWKECGDGRKGSRNRGGSNGWNRGNCVVASARC